MAAACCSPLALNETEKGGNNLRLCAHVNHFSRGSGSSSSTCSVPEAQVDDVAIHGDVGAEVVEHRGDVILSGTTRTELRQVQHPENGMRIAS